MCFAAAAMTSSGQIPDRKSFAATGRTREPRLDFPAPLLGGSPPHRLPAPAVGAVCQRPILCRDAARRRDRRRRFDTRRRCDLCCDRRFLFDLYCGRVFAGDAEQVPIQFYRSVRHDDPPFGTAGTAIFQSHIFTHAYIHLISCSPCVPIRFVLLSHASPFIP